MQTAINSRLVKGHYAASLSPKANLDTDIEALAPALLELAEALAPALPELAGQSLLQMKVAQRHSVPVSFCPEGPTGRGQM